MNSNTAMRALGLRLKAAPREQFAFEGREEAFAHRVVEAVADRAHRGAHPGFAATSAELDRGILAALARVMDDCLGAALPPRKIERLEHQLGAQMGLHRPAHDPAAEHVEYHREVEEPGPGRDIGDVGDPQAIGLGRAKLRSTRSGAGRALRARTVVWIHLRRLTPTKPALFNSRATRLRPTLMPSARSSAGTRGAP
jgi:hypothetical protein